MLRKVNKCQCRCTGMFAAHLAMADNATESLCGRTVTDGATEAAAFKVFGFRHTCIFVTMAGQRDGALPCRIRFDKG